MHPLAGADLKTLSTVFTRGGRVAPGKRAEAAGIWASALARWPASAAERLWVEDKLPPAEELAPIFILGHWRSGTTHLYNIMAKAGFAYVPPLATGLPWDLFGIVRTFRPLLEKALPEDRFIDAIPVNPDSPQEDEIALANMTATSFYHGIYFPRRLEEELNRGLFFDGLSEAEVAEWQQTFLYLLRKLSLFQDGRPLLIKNPVYTGRLAMLRRLLPKAKFIHIHRNPYDVFVSMRNFYAKLLKQFALQDPSHVDIDGAILPVYARMMHMLEADAAGMPESEYVELRYEDLDADALGAVAHVYERLALDGFSDAEPVFRAYLKSVSNYKKNKFSYAGEAAEKVEAHWRHFVDKWGYERPGRAQGSKAAAE